MNFAELAGDDTATEQPAPSVGKKRKSSFADLAGAAPAPAPAPARKTTAANDAGEPQFEFNDPAQMRAELVKQAPDRKDLLAAFDKQYSTAAPAFNPGRGSAPASAYVRGSAPASEVRQQPAATHWYDPLAARADVVGGIGETIANGVLGGAGAIAGGIANVAGSVATGSLDDGQKWSDWAKRNVSTVAGLYDPTPETKTGKGIQNVIDDVSNKVQKGAAYLGSSTLGATGSPALATVADVGTQAAAQVGSAVFGVRAARLLGGRISGGADALPAAMDKGGGKAPLSVPSQGLERQVLGGGAAVSSSNPYPTLTGQQTVRGGDFPQIKLSNNSGDLLPGEQAVRSAVASKILGENGDRIRSGVVSGNEDTLRTEAALAKASNPTPQGVMLRDKFAQEQRGLASFADGIVDSTGASRTMLNDGSRGDLMNSALFGPESLRSFLSTTKSQIYAEAAERQGPNPVQLPALEKMVNSPQLASSLKIAGQPNMLPGVQELVNQFKTNGFEHSVTGEPIAPNTVGAAMELHKALNSAWTPDNSMYIGRMKKSILDDVAQAGGADLYQRANAIHAAERTLLEAPGLKKIFGDVNPNTGIAQGLSPEKILPSINSLPVDQYSHVYNVFQDMANGRVPGAPDLQLPGELKQAGAQSVKEMSGSLVRDVQNAGADKAGVWNANSVNKTLNAHTAKLNISTPPDVIRDLHTLNVGGQIMPGMHSYEGAAQQARRLDQAGLLEQHMPKVGAVAGSLVSKLLPIPGLEVGGMMAGERLQAKAALKRQLKLADQTDAQMESAAKLGTRLKDLMK